jgi:Immunity protein 8
LSHKLDEAFEIKRLYSLDLPGPDDEPEDRADCWVRINADIGPTFSETADTFYLVVATPLALARAADAQGAVWGAHVLVIPRFDWEIVRRELLQQVEQVASQADTWEEFARRFSAYAAWEFADFEDARDD